MRKFFLLAAFACLVLPACAGNHITDNYSDSEFYTAGNGSTDARISKIEVDWLDGNVSIVYGETDVIRWEETVTSGKTDGHTQLYYRIVRGELDIHYCQSGRWNAKALKKDLVITLPRNSSYAEFDVECTNGAIDIDATATKVQVETVNGNATVHGTGDVQQINGESVRGDIAIYLPSNATFVAEYEFVNGNFSTDFQGSYSGTNNDGIFRTAGAPQTYIDLESVSGDLRVLQAK